MYVRAHVHTRYMELSDEDNDETVVPGSLSTE